MSARAAAVEEQPRLRARRRPAAREQGGRPLRQYAAQRRHAPGGRSARAAPSSPCRARAARPPRDRRPRAPARSPPRRAGRTRTSPRAARGRAARAARLRAAGSAAGDLLAREHARQALGLCAGRAARRWGRARSSPRGAGGGRRSAGTRPCARAWLGRDRGASCQRRARRGTPPDPVPWPRSRAEPRRSRYSPNWSRSER